MSTFKNGKVPDYGKSFRFPPEIKQTGDMYSIVNKLAVLTTEETDDIVIAEIEKMAKEEGITDLFLLNKKNIMSALWKQIPKKPILNDSRFAYFVCDRCGTAIAYSLEQGKHNYCLHCGQALDWGQENE